MRPTAGGFVCWDVRMEQTKASTMNSQFPLLHLGPSFDILEIVQTADEDFTATHVKKMSGKGGELR